MRHKRNVWPGLAVVLGAVLCSTGAAIADPGAEVVARLKSEGYAHVEVSKTWLRRVRIVAQGAPGLREVIVDPRNGAILRDFTAPPPDRPPGPDPRGRPPAPPSGGPAGEGPPPHDPPEPGEGPGPGGTDRPPGPGGPGGPGDGAGPEAGE